MKLEQKGVDSKPEQPQSPRRHRCEPQALLGGPSFRGQRPHPKSSPGPRIYVVTGPYPLVPLPQLSPNMKRP